MNDSNTELQLEEVVQPPPPQITPELIRAEVEQIPREEMVSELTAWRAIGPAIQTIMNMLVGFKQFAKNPDELAAKINDLTASYKGILEIKEKQIDDLMDVIVQYQKDPMGIGQKLEKLSKLALKRKLN